MTDPDRSVLDIEERAAGVREFRFAAARRKAPWQVGKASWQVGKASWQVGKAPWQVGKAP